MLYSTKNCDIPNKKCGRKWKKEIFLFFIVQRLKGPSHDIFYYVFPGFKN